MIKSFELMNIQTVKKSFVPNKYSIIKFFDDQHKPRPFTSFFLKI